MSGRVLVVEDEVVVAEGIREALESKGYQVRVFGTAREALPELFTGLYDLVIVDLVLPGGMSGKELISRLERTEGRRPKVIVITGLVTIDDDVVALHERYGVLQKPFRRAQLLEAVERALSGGGGVGEEGDA